MRNVITDTVIVEELKKKEDDEYYVSGNYSKVDWTIAKMLGYSVAIYYGIVRMRMQGGCGYCYEAIENMAANTGVDPNTMRKASKLAIEAGIVRVVGHGSSNVKFVVAVPLPEDLRAGLNISEPELSRAYKQAVRDVYGKSRKVAVRNYEKFSVVETELLNFDAYEPLDYAVTIAKVWKPWVAEHELEVVPLNVFLGKLSRLTYIKYKRAGIDLLHTDDTYAVILDNEMTIAKVYIDSNVAGDYVSIEDVAMMINASGKWYEAYTGNYRPIDEMLELFGKIYHMHCEGLTYDDIVCRLRERKKASTKN